MSFAVRDPVRLVLSGQKGCIAMSKLNLVIACGDYDRTRAIKDGRVVPEGIDLNFLCMEPEELFWRMIQNEEFDASEFSMGAYMIMQGRGERRFIAIPVFPSRMFRHACIFINANRGIQTPSDLKGKRVGVPDYTMTSPVWLRGTLSDLYGVKPQDMHWFTGGMNEPGRKQRIEATFSSHVLLEAIGDDRTLSDMLSQGEIDAIITSRSPACFAKGEPHIRRLWPDFRSAEKEYYQQTGIFPIMHTVVIRRDILERNPWVALSLYKAFCAAKDICIQEMMNTSFLRYTIPWYFPEVEETIRLMGQDFWPYGVDPNRKVLETLVRYAYEQGLTPTVLDIDGMFAANTLKLFKI
jgi:4,5-dihydroxyphthalate decarboxylase